MALAIVILTMVSFAMSVFVIGEAVRKAYHWIAWQIVWWGVE